jgi:hypothetical protein
LTRPGPARDALERLGAEVEAGRLSPAGAAAQMLMGLHPHG